MGKESAEAEELLEKIFYFMNQLVDNQSFESAILILTDMGRTLVNAERASFWYHDKKKKQYWTIAAWDSGRIVIPEGTGIVGASMEHNETICINEPYADDRFNPDVDKETGYVTRSILCMPVISARGEVIGAYQAINKLSPEGYGCFDDRDEKRLALAAMYCGKTLETHMLYYQTQEDQLTGLKNRRGFYEYYRHELHPQMMQQIPASAIMCDIDFFKKVNDTYGHNAGDAVLMHVANILENMADGCGQVIRWGGEEFVILLKEMALGEAAALAENIRQTVENSVCEFEGQDIKVTMSFGVRMLNVVMTPDENIQGVDDKLYEAKTTGRNKVVVAWPGEGNFGMTE